MIKTKVIYLLCLFCCLYSNGCRTIPKETNKICWNESELLNWKDYRGFIPGRSNYDAETYLDIQYQLLSQKRMIVSCFMKKNKSWFLSIQKTSLLLKHEKYHFNIAEIYAIYIRKEISKETSIDSNIKLRFSKLLDECNIEQDLYDLETGHSTNEKEQLKWESKIDSALIETVQYKNPIVNIMH